MNGERVCDPDTVKTEQWQYIMSLRSPAARRKEYQFLGLKNHLQQKDKVSTEQQFRKSVDFYMFTLAIFCFVTSARKNGSSNGSPGQNSS